jgi:predicted  nucleic acid-binding Zn-ribbon protein
LSSHLYYSLDCFLAVLSLFHNILQQDLLLEISELEMENKDNSEKLQSEIQKKVEEMDILQQESEKSKQHADLLEKQVNQLHDLLEEKDQLILQGEEREKKLEDHVKEVLKSSHIILVYVLSTFEYS